MISKEPPDILQSLLEEIFDEKLVDFWTFHKAVHLKLLSKMFNTIKTTKILDKGLRAYISDLMNSDGRNKEGPMGLKFKECEKDVGSMKIREIKDEMLNLLKNRRKDRILVTEFRKQMIETYGEANFMN